eukprot:TRINITY_DN6854_c0_g1_i1.p2 TRINITY_DN6854_c0_g1~~TRINITY_DN6854_c0_g1_i1.p2  ORF type:complete len:174 (-),score=56.98 TRINITY_DN6854_c0_g1_i1:768-1289(-)
MGRKRIPHDRRKYKRLAPIPETPQYDEEPKYLSMSRKANDEEQEESLKRVDHGSVEVGDFEKIAQLFKEERNQEEKTTFSFQFEIPEEEEKEIVEEEPLKPLPKMFSYYEFEQDPTWKPFEEETSVDFFIRDNKEDLEKEWEENLVGRVRYHIQFALRQPPKLSKSRYKKRPY